MTTYYSQKTGNATDTTVWNTVAGGGGSSPPSFSSLSNEILIVQSPHIVTWDGDSSSWPSGIFSMTINGPSGTLTFGQNPGFYCLSIAGGGYVEGTNNNGFGRLLMASGTWSNYGPPDPSIRMMLVYNHGNYAGGIGGFMRPVNLDMIAMSARPKYYSVTPYGSSILPITINPTGYLATDTSTFSFASGSFANNTAVGIIADIMPSGLHSDIHYYITDSTASYFFLRPRSTNNPAVRIYETGSGVKIYPGASGGTIFNILEDITTDALWDTGIYPFTQNAITICYQEGSTTLYSTILDKSTPNKLVLNTSMPYTSYLPGKTKIYLTSRNVEIVSCSTNSFNTLMWNNAAYWRPYTGPLAVAGPFLFSCAVRPSGDNRSHWYFVSDGAAGISVSGAIFSNGERFTSGPFSSVDDSLIINFSTFAVQPSPRAIAYRTVNNCLFDTCGSYCIRGTDRTSFILGFDIGYWTTFKNCIFRNQTYISRNNNDDFLLGGIILDNCRCELATIGFRLNNIKCINNTKFLNIGYVFDGASGFGIGYFADASTYYYGAYNVAHSCSDGIIQGYIDNTEASAIAYNLGLTVANMTFHKTTPAITTWMSGKLINCKLLSNNGGISTCTNLIGYGNRIDSLSSVYSQNYSASTAYGRILDTPTVSLYDIANSSGIKQKGHMAIYNAYGYTKSELYNVATHGTPPVTPNYLHYTICELPSIMSGIPYGYVRAPIKFLCPANKITIKIYAKNVNYEQYMSQYAKFSLYENVPHIDTTFVPTPTLASQQMSSGTNWQTLTLTYDNTGSTARYMILDMAVAGSGNASLYWFTDLDLGSVSRYRPVGMYGGING